MSGKWLYVYNLTNNVSEEHLKEIFGIFGTLKDVLFLSNDEKENNKYNFICAKVKYDKEEDAKSAKEHMNGGQIDGKIINVKWEDGLYYDKSKEEKSRSKNRSNSRSISRSRNDSQNRSERKSEGGKKTRKEHIKKKERKEKKEKRERSGKKERTDKKEKRESRKHTKRSSLLSRSDRNTRDWSRVNSEKMRKRHRKSEKVKK